MRKDKWKFYKSFAYAKVKEGKTYQVTCGECGHTNSVLKLGNCEKCGATFETFLPIKKRKFSDSGLINLFRVEKGKQIYEIYQMSIYSVKGEPIEKTKSIVLRMTFDENNKLVKYERKHINFNYFNKSFMLNSELKIKKLKTIKTLFKDLENISYCFGNFNYDNKKIVINSLTKGFKYACLNDTNLIKCGGLYRYILVYSIFPKIEFLVKKKCYEWVKYINIYYDAIYKNQHVFNFIKYHWNSNIRSLINVDNNYYYNTTGTFHTRLLDSIRMIQNFGNRCNITMNMLYQSKSLDKIHSKLIKVKDEVEAEQYEEEFSKKIKTIKYNPVENKNFIIKLLTSVKEFENEGNSLHHCVYKAQYYKRKDCIIFSARLKSNIDDPVETIEYRPSKKEIIQIRGDHDLDSQYHSEIVKLARKIKNNIQVVS